MISGERTRTLGSKSGIISTCCVTQGKLFYSSVLLGTRNHNRYTCLLGVQRGRNGLRQAEHLQ